MQCTSTETTSTGSLQEDAQGCSQVGQTGIVKIHITLEEISVKLDKRSPIVLRKFLHKQAWKQVYGFFSRGLAPGAQGIFRLKRGAKEGGG